MFHFLLSLGTFWLGTLAGCVVATIGMYISKKLSGSWDTDVMNYVKFLERAVDKSTLHGFAVKQGEDMKPGENVFTQDLYNMGRQIGLINGWRVMLMMGHHDDAEGHYFHIIREDTGEKITIIFEEDDNDKERDVIFRDQTRGKASGETGDGVTGWTEEG